MAAPPGVRRRPRKSKWNEERVVAALLEWGALHGRAPTLNEWKADRPDGMPATSTIRYWCGSWSNAMVACGWEARPNGDPRSETEASELYQRHMDGETLVVLAHEVGTTPQALGRRLRRWQASVREGASLGRRPER